MNTTELIEKLMNLDVDGTSRVVKFRDQGASGTYYDIYVSSRVIPTETLLLDGTGNRSEGGEEVIAIT